MRNTAIGLIRAGLLLGLAAEHMLRQTCHGHILRVVCPTRLTRPVDRLGQTGAQVTGLT